MRVYFNGSATLERWNTVGSRMNIVSKKNYFKHFLTPVGGSVHFCWVHSGWVHFLWSANKPVNHKFFEMLLQLELSVIGSEAATGDVLLKKLFLKISQYSQENTCVESLFNKVAGLKALRLQHRCFPENIAKFLRPSILKNVFERLLL